MIHFFEYQYACVTEKEQAAKLMSQIVIKEDEIDGAKADRDVYPLDCTKLAINFSLVLQIGDITELHVFHNDYVSMCGERDLEHGITRSASVERLVVSDFTTVMRHLFSNHAQKNW